MNRAKTAFALLVVFFAGCAAERLFVVPPARADTSPQRWEYTCMSGADDPAETAHKASVFGAKGWELVGAGTHMYGATWCFKRELP
jgi:hypothetical protein